MLCVYQVPHTRKPWSNTTVYTFTFCILSNCKESCALLLGPPLVAMCVCVCVCVYIYIYMFYDNGCLLPVAILV
jgi:hypothetical protein